MRRIMRLTSLVLSVFLLNINLFAQENASDIRAFLEELQKNQQEMRLEMQEIKSMLSRLPLPKQQNAPQPNNVKGIEFEIGDNPVLGSKSARLILVEFTDYQCQFCGRYVRETFPQIMDQYVDKGKIRYTTIDQPLAIHPDAAKAAEASHCAEDQGKFWEIHEAMMANQEALGDLSSYAETLKLNIGQFEDCLNTGKYKEAVRKDMVLASKLGVTGVPGFIIGTVDENDPRKVTGISMIRGAMPIASFQNEIDAALKR